jgi:hypothetical protein
VQGFDNRALPGVVPADNDRTSMKRDRVVIEATIILQAEGAEHSSKPWPFLVGETAPIVGHRAAIYSFGHGL